MEEQREKFSIQNLIFNFHKLKELQPKKLKNQQINELLDRIEETTQLLLWGEKQNDSFFEYFCEFNILETLYKITQSQDNKQIRSKIIESLSLLLINLSKGQQQQISLNYFMSNNLLNDFIMFKYQFADDEVAEQYISLLKSISQRINDFPIQLFINQKYPYFPLLQKSICFYNHNDQMIRTSMRNIFLTIIQNKQPLIINMISEFPFIQFYINLNLYLFDLWMQIDKLIQNQTKNNSISSKFKSLFDEQYDIITFINDILELKIQNINIILINSFIMYTFRNLILSITKIQYKLSPNFSLFLVYQLLRLIENSYIKQMILIYFTDFKIYDKLYELNSRENKLEYEKWSLQSLDQIEKSLIQLKEYQHYQLKSQNILYSLYVFQQTSYFQELEKYYQQIGQDLGVIVDDKVPNINELVHRTPLNLLLWNIQESKSKYNNHQSLQINNQHQNNNNNKNVQNNNNNNNTNKQNDDQDFIDNPVYQHFYQYLDEEQDTDTLFQQILQNNIVESDVNYKQRYKAYNQHLVDNMVQKLYKNNISICNLIIILKNLQILVDFNDQANTCYYIIILDAFQVNHVKQLVDMLRMYCQNENIQNNNNFVNTFITTFEEEFEKQKQEKYFDLKEVITHHIFIQNKYKNCDSYWRQPIDEEEQIRNQITKFFIIRHFFKKIHEQQNPECDTLKDYQDLNQQIYSEKDQLSINQEVDLKKSDKMIYYCKQQLINYVVIEDIQNLILGEVDEQFNSASIKQIINLINIKVEVNQEHPLTLIIIHYFKKYHLTFESPEKLKQVEQLINQQRQQFLTNKNYIIQNFLFLDYNFQQ